ncbi:sensor histidine kinase [Nocardioides jensenii]|uniref:sensor histidine kinase n=1 Tax=Nocardioides jensenii TaxID=1843 RepID=UPI00082ED09A|nr:HAMP domain-containing sensor histidine kinase [Nocardioides jensenii]
MTGEAFWTIVLVASLSAGVVGMLGFAGSWLVRQRSLVWQLAILALVAVLAPLVGLIAITRMMFFSGHDLAVATYVGTVAAVVTLGVALGLGLAIGQWSGAVRSNVRRLGTDGDLAPPSGAKEFRDLSAALHETRRELAGSREREQLLDQSRRDLVSWVSHDLRTPLAGLRAMSEALEDGLAADPQRYLTQIRQDVDRMATMVDDLFELSRIHAGVLVPQRETVLLHDLVSEAIASLDPVARTRDVHVGGAVQDGVCVSADPAALSRALSNLIMNAIRHTPPSGEVQVRAEQVEDGVVLSVADQCGGITEQDMRQVFEVGWQGSAARTPNRDLGGRAGLGLAIVRGIVEAHDGVVGVENLESADGCRFLIRLPSSPEVAAV